MTKKSINIKVTDVLHKTIKVLSEERGVSMREFVVNSLNLEILRINKMKQKYIDLNIDKSLIGRVIKYEDDINCITGINDELLGAIHNDNK